MTGATVLAGAGADLTAERPGAGVRAIIAVVRAYQLARAGRVSPCRFTPTCSEYAVVAFARHGLGRGAILTIRRLGRCHPLGRFGSDPVPE
ncbi:MAG: membrane protein insertion efficiency factor YidD [Acidimicrobiales bacterium]